MTGRGFRHDLPYALRMVWLILSIVSCLAVLAPLFLPPSSLFRIFPMCQAKLAGSSCILCGMTTAFVSIGQGDFAAAQRANPASLPLYFTLVLNFVMGITYTMMRVKRHASS
jgi:hypothetical protein